VAAQQKAITYLGVDDNVLIDDINNLGNLLVQLPNVDYRGRVNISDEAAVLDVLSIGMQALVLCPGNTDFLVTPSIIDLISLFVGNGGLLIYSANEGDIRAQQVSSWFPSISSLLDVQSSKSPVDYNTLKYWYYPFYNYNQYRAYATNESLTTSFGRISDGEYGFWGTPFHWFSHPLYWINNDTYHMRLTPQNEEYCMFKRIGNYSNSVDVNACWIFNFPYQQGKIVELGFALTHTNFTELDFLDYYEKKTFGALTAAFGQLLEDYLFETKYRNILVGKPNFSYPFGKAFNNVLYDLSLISNVYVVRDEYDFAIMQQLTNADAYVVPYDINFEKSVSKKFSSYYPIYDIRDFVLDGGNVVCILI